MKQRGLVFSIRADDVQALLREVCSLQWFRQAPDELTVNAKKVPSSHDWLQRILALSSDESAVALWGDPYDDDSKRIVLNNGGTVGCFVPEASVVVTEVLSLLDGLEFNVAVFGALFDSWRPSGTHRIAFADAHVAPGWACGFRGELQDRLPSARWLDFGPWLCHVASQVKLIQFHDLTVQPATAWQQAMRAHERMGISDVGGYLHPRHQIRTHIKGLYRSTDRSLTIARPSGQSMSQLEMLDLCVYRSRMRIDANEPIERIRVVFIEERDARRHLHELWLRELECWCFDADGREVRLDEAYQPERIVPEWVERAEGLEPRARPVGLRLSLGLANVLGENELPDRWCRDDLLLNILDHHTPAPNYSICEVLNADIPRVSASKGEEGDLVVEAAPGVLGALPAEKAAPLLEAARGVASDVDIRLPAERLGLTLPAIIVPEPYSDQRPFRLEDGHPLAGVVIHGVGDVLARVRSLNREDLRDAEALLQLCADQRFVLSARAGETKQE